MLENTITLSVDKANTGSPVSEVISRYEEFQNRSTYIADDHSFAGRHLIQVYRTFPQRSGNFRGQLKTNIKHTKDFTVLGVDGSNLVTPAIVDTNFSFPVGIADADVIEMIQWIISMLDDNVRILKIAKNLEI